MFVYCNNNPIAFIDFSGRVCIENHPTDYDEKNEDGFSVAVSEDFLNPYYCLYYAYEIESKYGKNWLFCGMDSERIAKEVYAHAVLYYVGEKLCTEYPPSVSMTTAYTDASLPVTINSSVVNDAINQVGSYLMEHGKDIYVNNDESWARMKVYDYLWNANTSKMGKAIVKMYYFETRRSRGPIKEMVK